MAKEEKTTDVAVTDEMKGSLAEYFGADVPKLEGVEFRFAQIKIAHQNQAWEMPDGDVTKKFKGVILHIQNVNVWWEKSFIETGGGVPPDCFSPNGIRPDMNSGKLQAKVCYECPQNVFGADGKRGKACKNMKRVYLKLDGYTLPVRMTVPPTSLASINEYVSSLVNRGIPNYIMAMTQFNLEKASNKDGIGYSKIIPVLLAPSAGSKEEAAELKNMRDTYKDLMVGEMFRTEDEYIPSE